MAQKKKNDFLTDSWRGTMASCLVIISTFVILFSVAGIVSKSYSTLLIVDGSYIVSLWGYVLLFSEKSRSESLKRFMMIFSIAGAAVSAFLAWSYFTFQM